jgi:signal transduction histidine kinase
VLVNLLHNAIKYGPNAGTISVAAGSQEHMTRVAVTDQGPGIPLDEQARLFDRFYRGRAGRLAGRGTGLGLAIARAVVQAHGGQIGVYSEPGAGSTFWFTIANQ